MKFLVIGAEHTGLDILKSVMDLHPDVKVFGEESYSILQDEVQSKNVIESGGYFIPHWTELFAEYDCIKLLAKNDTPIICMTRHPYSFVDHVLHESEMSGSSGVRVNCWNNKHVAMQNWLLNDRSIKKYIDFLSMDIYWQVRWATIYWLYKNECYLDMLKNNFNMYLVKYEDLIQNSQNTIRSIVDFLQLSSTNMDAMVDKCKIKPGMKWGEHITEDQITRWGEQLIDSQSLSLDKWKKRLTKKEISIIDDYTNCVTSQIGYYCLKEVSVVPDKLIFSNNFTQKIKLVDDSEFKKCEYKQDIFWSMDITNKDTTNDLTIFPWMGEHYEELELLKIKLYCDKHNIRLAVCGYLNYFPVLSLFADKVILSTVPCQKVHGVYGNKFANEYNGFPNDINPIKMRMFHNDYIKWPDLVVDALVEISNEEVINHFYNKTMLMRKSSFSSYEKLESSGDIPKNVIMCEIGDTDPLSIKQIMSNTDVFNVPVYGLDWIFQKELMRKTGHHYLSIQILSSLLSGWEMFTMYGAAHLFAFLPVKNIVISHNTFISTGHEEIIHGLANKRNDTVCPIYKLTAFPWTNLQIFSRNIQREQLLLLEEARKNVKWFDAKFV